MRPRPAAKRKRERSSSPEKLFDQVILSARPQILKIWEEGDKFIKKEGVNCPGEISFRSDVGRSYYQCQPHLWECYWEKGLSQTPEIEIDLFGQTFHIEAKPNFSGDRYYKIIHAPELKLHYGMMIDMGVREIPGLTQSLILTDTCRDVYLPQRIYAYGRKDKQNAKGFTWDNFDRKIFIDKFYVSNQQVNEWRQFLGENEKMIADPKAWPEPAVLNLEEQKGFCSFLGKRLMEAKLFDAATMPPNDTKNPLPSKIVRPQTPWHRDLSKTFLGMARINPDYQLTPLDCQLAQVEGCRSKLYTTDSASWMGVHFPIGFYPESFVNDVEPSQNIKLSSKFLPALSEWHELGVRSHWNGTQGDDLPPVAFRCYEEVSQ